MGSLKTCRHASSLRNTDLSRTVMPLLEKHFLLIRSSKADLQQVILNLRTIHMVVFLFCQQTDIAPVAEPIIIERNVDCAKRLGDGQLHSKGGRVLPVVLHGVGKDVLLIVSTAIVFTEELLGLQSHVGGGPLHPAHEHGDWGPTGRRSS